MPITTGRWLYQQRPNPPQDPGVLVQSTTEADAPLYVHAVDADGVDRAGLLGVLAAGDVVTVPGAVWTVTGVTDGGYPQVWRVGVTPDTLAPLGDALVPVSFNTAATPPEPIPPDPLPPLGATDVYASPEELAAWLGGSSSGTEVTQRRALALLAATHWTAYRVGIPFDDAMIPPGDLELVPVPARAAWREATLIAAVRFSRSGDAVFGAVGGFGDDAVYVRASIPEAELVLFGQSRSFGIA